MNEDTQEESSSLYENLSNSDLSSVSDIFKSLHEEDKTNTTNLEK